MKESLGEFEMNTLKNEVEALEKITRKKRDRSSKKRNK